MKFIKTFLFCITGVVMAMGLFARETAEISVKTNLKDARKISVIPLNNFRLYDLDKGELDEKGQGKLQVTTKTPLLGMLKIATAEEKPLSSVVLYIAPAGQLKVEVIMKEGGVNPVVSFEGKWNKENAYLRTLPMVFLNNMSWKDVENTLRKLEEKCNQETYSAEFKSYMQQVLGALVLTKQLPAFPADSKERATALKSLLRDLKHETYWQSMPQWPDVVDIIFKDLEFSQLIKPSKDGLSNRLKCIGDEDIRNWYGVYVLQRWVNFRSWYEEQPIDMIKKMRPYFTTEYGKKEFELILKQYNRIENNWGHLRNRTAPDFNFEDVNGNMVKLSDYRGKFVLLDVWNIYCGPCMNQVPYLKKFEPELEKMGVVVIGVSCDPQKIKDKWRNTVKSKGMPGIQVIMDNGRGSAFMKDYSIAGFPTFCLIGPDGVVINPYMPRPEISGFMKSIRQKIDAYNQKY